MPYEITNLDASTWPLFAELVERNNGIFGGCWCQYGSPAELSRIKHVREYGKAAPPTPDWRITCIYVDKKHRGQGVARAALEGALEQIALAGGGLVEAISETTTGRDSPRPIPVQRHRRTRRAVRLRPRPPGRQARVDREQAGVNTRPTAHSVEALGAHGDTAMTWRGCGGDTAGR